MGLIFAWGKFSEEDKIEKNAKIITTRKFRYLQYTPDDSVIFHLFFTIVEKWINMWLNFQEQERGLRKIQYCSNNSV